MGAYEKITVELPRESAEAMRRSIAEGAYASTDEIIDLAVRDWLNAKPSEEGSLAALRAAIREGEESGPGIPAEQVYAELDALIATFERQK